MSNALQRLRRYGESKQHEQAKEKVAQVLRQAGFNIWIDDYIFRCQTQKGLRIYWPDVYAQSFCNLSYAKAERSAAFGARRIIVEVQGFAGHKSKAAFQADNIRIQDIRTGYGSDIEYYEVHLNKRIGPLDIRSWTMEDICLELNIQK